MERKGQLLVAAGSVIFFSLASGVVCSNRDQTYIKDARDHLLARGCLVGQTRELRRPPIPHDLVHLANQVLTVRLAKVVAISPISQSVLGRRSKVDLAGTNRLLLPFGLRRFLMKKQKLT